MKKVIVPLTIFGAILLASTNVVAQTNTNRSTQNTQQDGKWKRSSTGTWQGTSNGTTYTYRTDKNGKLTWTSDSKKWSDVTDNRWMGYDGRWYRIQGDNLMWSVDGTSWTNSTDRTWRGSDGTWYMFDKNWSLYTGGNGTLPPSTTNMK